MIEADVVEIVRGPTHAIDPPGISALLHHVPAIEWIAPALAIFAEKIRRDTGHDLGIEFGVEAKQIGMGPDIGAIEIHEDGNVTGNPDQSVLAVGAKCAPLFVKEKLDGAAN